MKKKIYIGVESQLEGRRHLLTVLSSKIPEIKSNNCTIQIQSRRVFLKLIFNFLK